MALTGNRELDRYVDQELRRYAVAAGAHVYKGGFVGLNASGYARGLVAGDRCVGIAYEEADNSGGADAGVYVRVFTLGDFSHTLAGAAVTDIGKPLYASADDTLTLTAAGNSFVGWVVDRPSANTVIVRLGVEAPAGSLSQVVGAATEIDCELGQSPQDVTVIPAAWNAGGLLIEECVGVVTEVFGGATQDQGIITLKDSDGTSLNVTLTPSDAGADAVNDVVVAAGTSKTAERAATGDPAAVVAAGKGVRAVVTQATSGAGAAGKVRVIVKAVRLAG
jgi:hypothetical protein